MDTICYGCRPKKHGLFGTNKPTYVYILKNYLYFRMPYQLTKVGLGTKTLRYCKKNIFQYSIVLAAVALSVNQKAFGQVSGEYLIKAVFIEKFTRFITWPVGSNMNSADSAVVINIIGNHPFNDVLRSIYRTQKINNKPVKIVNIARVQQLQQPDILFIGQTDAETLNAILDHTRGKPILTIADQKNYAHKGVIINFYVKNDRIAFEINEQSARESHLAISYRLLNTATIVNPVSKQRP